MRLRWHCYRLNPDRSVLASTPAFVPGISPDVEATPQDEDTQNGRVQIIRLPGSGGSGLAGANRVLTGPLRACIIPLLLIILAIVAGIIYRVMKRRKNKRLAPVAEHAAEESDDAS